MITNREDEKSWLIKQLDDKNRLIMVLFIIKDNYFMIFDVFQCHITFKILFSDISQISKTTNQQFLQLNINKSEYIITLYSDTHTTLNEIIAHLSFNKAGFASQQLILKFNTNFDKFTVLESYNDVQDIVLKLNHTHLAINTNHTPYDVLMDKPLWFISALYWVTSTKLMITFLDSDTSVTLTTFDAYQMHEIVLFILSRTTYHAIKDQYTTFFTKISPKLMKSPSSVASLHSRNTDSPKNLTTTSFLDVSDEIDTTEEPKKEENESVNEISKKFPEEKISFIEEVIAKKNIKCVNKCSIS